MKDKQYEVHHWDINADPNKHMIKFGSNGNLAISNECNSN